AHLSSLPPLPPPPSSPSHADHLHPHSFPTRRSSDLGPRSTRRPSTRASRRSRRPRRITRSAVGCCRTGGAPTTWRKGTCRRPSRSEEHTSELQSRFDLVCRLLLEKKKRI